MSGSAPGTPQAADKPKPAAWTKWLTGFAAAAAIIVGVSRLYAAFAPAELPACGDGKVRTSIGNILRERAKIEIATFDRFDEVSRNKDLVSCTTEITAPDNSRGRLSYRVLHEDGKTMVRTDKLEPL